MPIVETVNVRATPDGRLTLKDAALYLGFSPRTLRNRDGRGLAPRPLRVGGRVFYRLAELDAFISAGTSNAA